MSTSLLVLGATGFIGGSVLAAIRKAYPASTLAISALVRKETDHAAVRALDVTIVPGTKADVDLIRDAASKADVVLAALDNNDVDLAKAVIAGLEARAKSVSRKPVLIHTSGIGSIGEESQGNFKEGKTYDDSNEDDIRSIPATNMHRPADLEVLAADARGLIAGYIISPAATYGPGSGPVRRVSMGLQLLIHIALKRGSAVVVGDGSAVWSDIHIDDLVALYVRVFAHALGGSHAPSPYAKFFFGAGHPLTWDAWARTINTALRARGLVQATEPLSVAQTDEPYIWFCTTNTRPKAVRGRTIGWVPEHPSFEETLPTELDALLKPMVF